MSDVNAEKATLRKYFERTGCLLTADGSGDDRVHLPGGIELGDLPPSLALSNDDEPSAIGLGEGKRAGGEGKEEKKEQKGESKVTQENADNQKHDEDELDLDEEDDPDEGLVEVALRDAIPDGWEVAPLPPDLDKTLIGKKIVLRWNVTGWAVAIVKRFYSRPKGAAGYNFELRYQVGGGLVDTLLHAKHYTVRDGMPAGSWCVIAKPR